MLFNPYAFIGLFSSRASGLLCRAPQGHSAAASYVWHGMIGGVSNVGVKQTKRFVHYDRQ
jgi:hypothetical protein